MSPRSSATARRRLPKDGAGHRHLAVGRDGRYARGAALLQGARPAHARGRQRAESTIAREVDADAAHLAGPEIGVASTKAFTCQLTVLACLAIAAGRARGTIDADEERELVRRAHRGAAPHGGDAAGRAAHRRDRRATSRRPATSSISAAASTIPIALEGALKLKEISYIHAEGYAAGELKHGPIALIDEDVPVDRHRPADDLYDKTVSNMEEVAARGGQIVLLDLTPIADARRLRATEPIIRCRGVHAFIAAASLCRAVQLIAYHRPFMGTDVDQPRNLAKSVTVE